MTGHNNPPSQIEFTRDISKEISQFLLDNPSFVENEELARAAKLWLDRAKLCRADLEAERKSQVDPLRALVEGINDTYRSPRESLDTATGTLERRIADFLLAKEREHARRIEDARRAVEETEKRAREAEAREQEAHEDAKAGVVVDTVLSTVAADAAFKEFERASRFAARVEAEKVKVGGGLRHATSLRKKETLLIQDPPLAIRSIWEMAGLSEGLQEAIRTEARAYRKIHGHLPEGVESKIERDV